MNALAAIAVFVAAATGVEARGFLNTANNWEAMPADARSAYVQGLNDSANFIFINDDLATAVLKVARTRCLIEHKTTAASLANSLTNLYVNNRQFANQPPIVVYVAFMGATCKGIINEERQRLELPPIQ
jgi:hypothetical protein